MSSKSVWLITGASSGLGYALARHVLANGHKVIATSRDPSKNPDLVTEIEGKGGRWLALDYNWKDEDLQAALLKANSYFDRIDVLVNNAGYGVFGATEDVPTDAVKAQMQTNFFGPLSVMRGVLPSMRQRRSGVIMNISSAQGLCPSGGNGAYAASKAALEAATDALKQEMQPFGVRVLAVLPGAYKTGLPGAGKYFGPSEPYTGDHPVGKRLEHVKKLGAVAAPGDTAKAARVMFEAVTGEGEAGAMIRREDYLRLIIGSDCWRRADEKATVLRATVDAQKAVAASTDA